MSEISVIVPVYNKIRYLNSMLDSVLNQTFSDYELILIDDGSTDGSDEILDEYALKDQRIKVHHIKNGGVSHARNVGLDMASGTYITFIDSDDTVAADYLGTLYKYITENSTDIVISGVAKIWPEQSKQTVVLPPYTGKKEMADVLSEFASVQKRTGVYGYCAAKMFSREMTGNQRFDETLVLAEDFDFYLRLYEKTQSIYFADYAGYYYIQAADNSPMNVKDDEIDYYSQLLIQQRFAAFLKGMNAYSDENRKTVDTSLQNYMYLTLHYASSLSFDEKFKDVHNIYKQNEIPLTGNNIRQKTVLSLLKQNNMKTAKAVILGYRWLRKAVRR